MIRLADIYVQQFKITLASFVQYRAAIFIWMIWHVIEPLVYLSVWSVVTRSLGGNVGGFTGGDFASYFIAMMLVNHLTYTWIMWEFEYRVRHGILSFMLLRPIHPIHSDIVDNVTSKLLTLPMMIPSAMLLALLFRPVFHPVPWAMAAFVPAVFLAFLLRFIVEWALSLAVFWTTRISAVNQGYYVITLFLAGQMAPLALLPGAVRIAATVLPFRWMISFPVELLLGRLTPQEALAGIGAQIVWLAIGFTILRRAWRAGLRIYSAVGA
ncbi:ABC-2 family transporter protein [bacterium]|nr:ABC-2 family transporter protein [bacterium]